MFLLLPLVWMTWASLRLTCHPAGRLPFAFWLVHPNRLILCPNQVCGRSVRWATSAALTVTAPDGERSAPIRTHWSLEARRRAPGVFV